MYSRIAYIFSPAVVAVKEGLTYTYKLNPGWLCDKQGFGSGSVSGSALNQCGSETLVISIPESLFVLK